jgi:MFS family permease
VAHPWRSPRSRRRLAALADPNLRLLFTGQATSLFGSAISGLAVTFAVLDGGGSQSELGYVIAARILPLVMSLLGGGVIADRFGPRRVMLAADVLRCLTQAVLALALLTGPLPIWVFLVTAMAVGVGDGFFMPALGALVPAAVAGGRQYEGKLQDANALTGLARSAASVAGPALAGVAVALTGPGAAVAFDAVTYAVSFIALALLRLGSHPAAAPGGRGLLADAREGWQEFRKRTWMWVTTVQFAMFNFLVWAPFLVLGPVVAHHDLGGARAWGLIMTGFGGGTALGGAAMLGRRQPRRPMLAATLATFGYALPPAAIAARLPTLLITCAALLAGIGSAVCGVIEGTVEQQQVPAAALARITSITTLGAFGLGPIGLTAAGPAAAATSITAVLGFGALWQIVTCALVLAVPDVRRLTSQPDSGADRDGAPAGLSAR